MRPSAIPSLVCPVVGGAATIHRTTLDRHPGNNRSNTIQQQQQEHQATTTGAAYDNNNNKASENNKECESDQNSTNWTQMRDTNTATIT